MINPLLKRVHDNTLNLALFMRHGLMPWDSEIDYQGSNEYCTVGTNVFCSIMPSGPGTAAGPQDPMTSTGYWLGYALSASLTGYPGEFRSFYEQSPPPGWAVRNGAVLSNVSTGYSLLLSELQKPANAWKCGTLAQWNALSATAGGVGGVPFFVVDASANTIKLPDTRNDYERAIGSLLANVGTWHGDAVQTGITGLDTTGMGNAGEFAGATPIGSVTKSSTAASSYLQLTAATSTGWRFTINQRFASETRTRAFGVLPCVYVGGN